LEGGSALGHSQYLSYEHPVAEIVGYAEMSVDDNDLDPFDVLLLESNQAPDFDPKLIEVDCEQDFNRGMSPPPPRVLSATNSEAVGLRSDPGHIKAPPQDGGDRLGARLPGDNARLDRPTLLRPSEDEPLEAEPFRGFSRPWMLY
jgi:hypothetical protein